MLGQNTLPAEAKNSVYIHSVKLINYKSFGDYPESKIILEPRVTAIIGKNESGKSNILDGLSRIDFLKQNPSAFSETTLNRNSNTGTDNTYLITLKPEEKDSTKGINGDSLVEITKDHCVLTGGLLEHYLQHVSPDLDAVTALLDSIGSNPMQLRDTELNSYRTYKETLSQKEQIELYKTASAFVFFTARITRIPKEFQEEFKNKLEVARNNWSELTELMPVFFYRKENKHLNTSYRIDEVEKELNNPNSAPNSLLHDFVKLIDISSEDFMTAVRSGSSPKQESLRRKINKRVDDKINKPFHTFYQTETIQLDLGFNAGIVSFVVQSEDGEALMLSERSNGLRWYLEAFIDAQSNEINRQNVVYLFDEPGTSLHVNAQRELLSLFHHLSEKGNQVVYTTHSPYMLDLQTDGVHRIRAVVKNTEGYSYIYKTAYDPRISPDSQKDTLAPIISAIGMNLNDTFGPAKDKLNIVTEGMSDYIYLCTMAKVLNIDTTQYVILPSIGASNCINICCILQGWGCRYLALFDYDKEGVEKGGEYLNKKMMLEYQKQYCYLADVSYEDVRRKTYKEFPYRIEDVVTRSEITRYFKETEKSNTTDKVLTAKLMSNDIESGAYAVGDECKSNFKDLFNRMISIGAND